MARGNTSSVTCQSVADESEIQYNDGIASRVQKRRRPSSYMPVSPEKRIKREPSTSPSAARLNGERIKGVKRTSLKEENAVGSCDSFAVEGSVQERDGHGEEDFPGLDKIRLNFEHDNTQADQVPTLESDVDTVEPAFSEQQQTLDGVSLRSNQKGNIDNVGDNRHHNSIALKWKRVYNDSGGPEVISDDDCWLRQHGLPIVNLLAHQILDFVARCRIEELGEYIYANTMQGFGKFTDVCRMFEQCKVLYGISSPATPFIKIGDDVEQDGEESLNIRKINAATGTLIILRQGGTLSHNFGEHFLDIFQDEDEQLSHWPAILLSTLRSYDHTKECERELLQSDNPHPQTKTIEDRDQVYDNGRASSFTETVLMEQDAVATVHGRLTDVDTNWSDAVHGFLPQLKQFAQTLLGLSVSIIELTNDPTVIAKDPQVGELVEPVKSPAVELLEEAEPLEQVEPVEQAEPSEPMKPAEMAELIDALASAEPPESSDPAQPAEIAETAETAVPAQPNAVSTMSFHEPQSEQSQEREVSPDYSNDLFDQDEMIRRAALAAHAALTGQPIHGSYDSPISYNEYQPHVQQQSEQAQPVHQSPYAQNLYAQELYARATGAISSAFPQNHTTAEQYERARLAATAKAAAKNKHATPTPSQRRPWTQDEENALMTGLDRVQGPHWSQILAMYGAGGTISEVLKDRNQVQLKDKARNLKLFFLKSGHEVPHYLKHVTGELKTRAPATAAKNEARTRLQESAGEDKAAVNAINFLAAGRQTFVTASPQSERGTPIPGMQDFDYGTRGSPSLDRYDGQYHEQDEDEDEDEDEDDAQDEMMASAIQQALAVGQQTRT